MPKATPPPVKQEVVQLYLEGYTQEGIVKRRVVKSLGNVSNILREFRSECEVDIATAVEKYGVRDTIEIAHDLNADCLEAKVGVKEAKEGAEFLLELRKTGTDLEDLKDFVRKLVRAAGTYDIELIVKYAKKLYDLEQKTGKPYEKLLADFEEKSGQIGDLMDQKKRLEEEKKVAEKSTEKALRDAKVAKEEIADYVRTRGLLLKHNLKTSDIQTIATVFENIREHDEDYKKIIRTVKETEKISLELVKIKDEIAEKKEELKSLSMRIQDYKRSEKEFEKLSEQGLTLQNMQKLNLMAKRYDTPEEFLNNLHKAYELFGGIFGLEGQKSKLENEVKIAQAKKERILAENDITNVIVKAVLDLREKNIGSKEIIQVHLLAEKYGPDFLNAMIEKGIQDSKLQEDLSKRQSEVSGLIKRSEELGVEVADKEKIIQQGEKRIKDLDMVREEAEKRLVDLTPEVKRLGDIKDRLQEAIKEMTEFVSDKVNTVGAFNVLRKLIDSPETLDADPRVVLGVIFTITGPLETYMSTKGKNIINGPEVLQLLGDLSRHLSLIVRSQ